MALEDRSSPNSASSPGPTTANDRPGTDGNAVNVTSPPPVEKTETRLSDDFDLNRKIKIEPEIESENFPEKNRIWRKISEDESSRTPSPDREKRLLPKSALPAEIIQRFSSYSIERFVNSPTESGENRQYPVMSPHNVPFLPNYKNHKIVRSPESDDRTLSPDKKFHESSEEEMPENHHNHHHTEHRIKFSVDDILKPDFGSKYIQKHVEIWNPLKRTVTPIIRTSDELRKPRIVQNRTNRNFDIARLTETDVTDERKSLDEFPKRRNSELCPVEASKLQERRRTTDGITDGHINRKDQEKTNVNVPLASPAASSSSEGDLSGKGTELWPAWVYCTRYSDRPSSGR